MLQVKALSINLQIEIEDGQLQKVIYEPISSDCNLTKKLIVEQDCPHCVEPICLNIIFNQGNTIHEDKVIKEEATEDSQVKLETDLIASSSNNEVDALSEFEEEKPQKKKAPKRQIIKNGDLSCKSCGTNFKTRKGLYEHQRNCLIEEVVCHQCDDKKTFSRMDTFFMHSKKEHNSKLMCHICRPHKFFRSGKQWSPHIKAHNRLAGKESYECGKCHKKFLLKQDYQSHVDDYFKGEMCCRLCEDKPHFMLRSVFSEHLKTVHSYSTFPCPFCDAFKDFDTEVKLQQHMSQVHWTDKRFWCLFCKKKFKTLEEKHAHSKDCSFQAPENQISCSYCAKRFAQKHSLLYHMRTVHRLPRASYVCHLCGRTFVNSAHYNFHMQHHEMGSRPFECHHCSRKFQSKKSITFHILRFHYPRDLCTIHCEVCDDRFATQELRNRHMVQHKEKVRCKCEICGKMLAHKAALVQHKKRQHTVEGQSMKFRCDQCDFTTTKDFYLKKHKIQHLSDAEKPYQCKFCGKGFLNRNIGTRHEWAHTDTRPFTCDICGKSFRHHTDLNSHKRLHTGEKPYECQVCQKRFADRGCFRSHLVKHEKELNITLDKSIKKKPIIIGVDVKPGPSIGNK